MLSNACKYAIRSILYLAMYADETNKIGVRKNQINYKLKVNDIPESRMSAKLVDIYRTDITPKDAFAAQDTLKYSKDYYRKKGVGRPTKKDRRDIEGYQDENEE